MVEGARTNCRQLMERLFELCMDSGLVAMPAWVCALLKHTKHNNFGLRNIYRGCEFLMMCS